MEEFKEELWAYLEKSKADQEKVEADSKTGLDGVKATDLEANVWETECVAAYQEVPNEEASGETITEGPIRGPATGCGMLKYDSGVRGRGRMPAANEKQRKCLQYIETNRRTGGREASSRVFHRAAEDEHLNNVEDSAHAKAEEGTASWLLPDSVRNTGHCRTFCPRKRKQWWQS
jgi:hypothetical protein